MLHTEELETRIVPSMAVPTIWPTDEAVQVSTPVAGDANDDLDTPADTIHPNIHQNNDAGSNANPNGKANNGKGAGAGNGGGNIHGIANNPGKSGDKPNDDGVKGFANELATVHGGIAEVNKNVD